jgi:uncharacterized damage-inducible protein DinB
MNAPDILKYGHGWFLKAVDGLSEEKWETPGATGTWSSKDILSHITSYEVVLVDLLNEFLEKGQADKPYAENHQQFNDEQVAKRKDQNFQEILDEYNQAYEKVAELINRISPEKCREVGTLAWYGPEYSLDDYLVYNYYGHKREHGAQIAEFKNNG